MLFLGVGGDKTGIYTFNYTTNNWTLVDSYLPNNTTWLPPFGSWDDSAHKFVISIGENPASWYTYDPAVTGTPAWANLTATAPADVTGKSCAAGGIKPCYATALTYDATNRRTIVLTQDPGNVLGLWAYNAVTGIWRKVTTVGGSGATSVTGYPNTLHYDPPTASIYLLDRIFMWQYGNPGEIRTLKITLDLDNPLPTNAPAPTSPNTVTPTEPASGLHTPSPSPRTTRTPATPTIPIVSPTPTCQGTVRWVGPARTYAKPSDAAAVVQTNDCVYIDAGSYPNDVALWPAHASNVTIAGVNGLVKLAVTNGKVYGRKGIWVVDGSNTTIENIEFACATSRANNAHCSGILVGDENDAGIRLQAPGLTVRNCIFHDNDNGILGGPNVSDTAGDVLIENSEFFRNGRGDGFTHNLYLNAHNASLTFRNNYSHAAITGHLLKSRAAINYILYNRLMDEDNGVTSCTNAPACMSSAEIDLPCGGIAYVIGNVIQKGPRADSRDTVKFAAELGSGACPQPPLTSQELYVINNTMVTDYGATTYFLRGFGSAPLLWAKNNIFWGGATQPISWPPGGIKVEQANVTADPKLVSQATYDYHLTATSTAVVNRGVDPGTDSHGYSLMPTQHYTYDRGTAVRLVAGALDVGGFEYVGSVTPFPTPSSTPTNTPTPTLVWTPTPRTSVYCSAGQLEAVYPIAASADDGIVERSGRDYDSLTPSHLATGGSGNYIDYASRRNVNGNYTVGVVAWRWNTAARPDGSAWPPGMRVADAHVRPYWAGAGTGPRPLVFEWHDWRTPLSQSDWTRDSVTLADSTFAATTAMPTVKGRQTITLTNAPTNVNLAGYTGLRLMVTDGFPPALNEDNIVPVRPQDYQTSAGDQSAELVICYSIGATPTPQPPSAPRLL